MATQEARRCVKYTQNNSRSRGPPRHSYQSIFHSVPTKYVGMLIGKGGGRISEIRHKSKAKIYIATEDGNDDTAINICGLQKHVSTALSLIDGVLNSQIQRTLDNTVQTVETIKDITPRPPIKKRFYVADPAIANMCEEEVEHFRKQNNNIIVHRTVRTNKNLRPIPNPVETFAQVFQQYPTILEEIKKVGLKTPTPIQCQGWPIILSGENLIGISPTGTGKTLTFLLPALIHAYDQTERATRTGPSVLIVVPTRELTLAMQMEADKYHYKFMTIAKVHGGVDRHEQIKILADGIDVLIGTPGRLNDLVDSGHLTLKFVTFLVIDEADRMLNTGFETQMRKLVSQIRPDRQTIMMSSTWPMTIKKVAKSFIRNSIEIHIGSANLFSVKNVIQVFILMNNDDPKFDLAMKFVSSLASHDRAIIFCQKKARAQFLCDKMIDKKFRVQCIHGDLSQNDREQALSDMVTGVAKILIATDVASCGIEFKDFTVVLNYDFPSNIQEYVHRISNANNVKTGYAITYFTYNNRGHAADLISVLENSDQYIPQEFIDLQQNYRPYKQNRGGRREYQYGFADSTYDYDYDNYIYDKPESENDHYDDYYDDDLLSNSNHLEEDAHK